MAGRRRDELEQRLIDHEIRLSRAREAWEVYTVSRGSRTARRNDEDEHDWYRAQLREMLAAAHTAEELDGLGLSDRVIREAGLGDSLWEAWARFRPPPRSPEHAPPPSHA